MIPEKLVVELRHLRYFVAVARARNFTRVVERLHIAQPPLNRQVQQLEDELGIDLIEAGRCWGWWREAGICLVPASVERLRRDNVAYTGQWKRFRLCLLSSSAAEKATGCRNWR